MLARSLPQLRAEVRNRTEKRNALLWLPDWELNGYIQGSKAELYDKLTTTYEDYNLCPTPFVIPVIAGAQNFPMPLDFFKSRGIPKCTTRLVSEGDSDLPGFKKMVWQIDVPKAEFIPLGSAIATLENDEPLLEIDNLSIDATREDAQYQHATLILSTLVKS